MTAAGLVRTASARIGRADAEFIACHLLGRKRHELYLDAAAAPEDVTRRFEALVTEVAAGRPVQYVTNSAPFLDFELYVDERVLIPRPETEELVTRAAARVSGVHGPGSTVLLDYGTGSGCIAIALARMLPGTRVCAVDASDDALAVCGRNVECFGLGARITLLAARDLTHPAFAGMRGAVGLLISNPPYIPSARIPELDPKVRDYEPLLALDGGPKGTNILSMLVSEGPRMLGPGGLIAFEIDSSQPEELLRLAPAGTVETDLAGRSRYFFLQLP